MNRTDRVDTPAGFWAAVGCQVILSVVFAAVLGWVQTHMGFGWWVLNLAAFGPGAAALVTLAVSPARGWPVGCLPRPSRDGRTIRRSLAAFVAGAAVVALALQVYAGLRWNLKHVVIDLRPHPFVAPLSDPAWLLIWVGVGLVLSCAASEFGWRVVLHPTLRQRCDVIGTSLIIGVGSAAVQLPWLSGVLTRFRDFGRVLDVVLFIVFAVIAMVAIQVVLTVIIDPMRRGNWLAATCFAWPLWMGLFCVLDDEAGRWQAMAALAISGLILCTAALTIWRRGIPEPLGETRIPVTRIHE